MGDCRKASRVEPHHGLYQIVVLMLLTKLHDRSQAVDGFEPDFGVVYCLQQMPDHEFEQLRIGVYFL